MCDDSKIVKALTKARALIEDKTRWTQWAFARDSGGEAVPPLSLEAVCWCARGALWATSIDIEIRLKAVALLSSAAKSEFYTTIFSVNDMHGHSAIIRCFDLAIERAKGENV